MRRLEIVIYIFLFLFFMNDSKSQTLAIKATHLIDGKSDGSHDSVTVIVENNKIQSVGKNIEIPSTAEILNLDGKTILPGFIDAHTHIMVDGVEDYGAEIYKNSTNFRAIRAVSSVQKALLNGFTSKEPCTLMLILKKQ